MRLHAKPKYRLPQAPRRRWPGFLLGLLLAALLVVGWIGWRNHTAPQPVRRTLPHPPAVPASRPPASTNLAGANQEIPNLRPATATPFHPLSNVGAVLPGTNLAGQVLAQPLTARLPTNRSIGAVIQTNWMVPGPDGYPRRARDVLERQLALERLGFSAGSLDGLMGAQTRSALVAWQKREGMRATGSWDEGTRARLWLVAPPFTNFVVAAEDLDRLQPVSETWLGKSRQSALDYETVLELVAERSHTNPALIRRLNPKMDWAKIAPGTSIRVPNASLPLPIERAAFIRIRLADRLLEAFGSTSNLLVQFPCSIAQRIDKRPVGELRVKEIVPNPDYTFNPEIFPDAPESSEPGRKLIIPPGPNNPVGTVWIGLDRPGYGIHGTPRPEDVGRTESRGCFRLANWNAEHLLQRVWVGMPVRVE